MVSGKDSNIDFSLVQSKGYDCIVNVEVANTENLHVSVLENKENLIELEILSSEAIYEIETNVGVRVVNNLPFFKKIKYYFLLNKRTISSLLTKQNK